MNANINFQSHIKNKIAAENLNRNINTDPNSSYDALHDIMSEACDTFFPKTKIKFNNDKHKKHHG